MENRTTELQGVAYLPYGITQCNVLPDTSEHNPPVRPVLELPTRGGWKAELT